MFPEFRAAGISDEEAQQIFDDFARYMNDGKDAKTICALVQERTGIVIGNITYRANADNILQDKGPDAWWNCTNCIEVPCNQPGPSGLTNGFCLC